MSASADHSSAGIASINPSVMDQLKQRCGGALALGENFVFSTRRSFQ
jgi:hypothetical protein